MSARQRGAGLGFRGLGFRVFGAVDLDESQMKNQEQQQKKQRANTTSRTNTETEKGLKSAIVENRLHFRLFLFVNRLAKSCPSTGDWGV